HLFDVASYRRRNCVRNDLGGFRNQCLIELHPLNVFWIPKASWQKWGAHLQVKAHFADMLKAHVGSKLWTGFIRFVGDDLVHLPEPDSNFQYAYTEEEWRARAPVYNIRRTTTNLITPQVRQIVASLARTGLSSLSETNVRHILEEEKASGTFHTRQD